MTPQHDSLGSIGVLLLNMEELSERAAAGVFMPLLSGELPDAEEVQEIYQRFGRLSARLEHVMRSDFRLLADTHELTQEIWDFIADTCYHISDPY
jgi:hypothetical protein